MNRQLTPAKAHAAHIRLAALIARERAAVRTAPSPRLARLEAAFKRVVCRTIPAG